MRKKKFNGEEVVFYRLKIRSKTANVAEVHVKGLSRHLGSIPEDQSDLGTFMVPSPEPSVGVAIFSKNFE